MPVRLLASHREGADWRTAFPKAFAAELDTFYVELKTWRSEPVVARTIAGRVVTPAGTGVPGITVSACQTIVPGGCGHALTDVDGSYAIAALQDDEAYRIQFGRSPDGNLADGFYGTNGFVQDPSAAELIRVNGTLTGLDIIWPESLLLSP